MNDDAITGESSPSEKKTWRTGTLVYGTAGIAALFFWMLWGDFTWSMKERAVGSIGTLIVKTFGISDLFFGLLMVSFPNFTNIFLGPIVSYLSDRYRGRWGRRIPFLLFTIPFVVTGVIGIGFSPTLGRHLSALDGGTMISPHTAGLICFAVFWASLDFGTTLSNVLFTALVNDVVPVVLLGRFLALFRAISLGAGIFFNYFLLEQVETYSILICLALGILYGLGLTSLCFKVKEGSYPPPEPKVGQGNFFFQAVKTYFSECFSQPYYLWVFAGFILCVLANQPVNIFTIFYAQSVGMSMGTVGKCLAVTYIISLFLCYILGSLADRVHPLRMAFASMVIYGLVMLGGFLLATNRHFFAIFLVAHGVAAGIFNTAVASYPMRLFPRALFAQFNSALFMLQSLIITLMAPILGYVLDLTGSQYRYTFMAGLVLSVAALLALSVVYRYFMKLGGDRNYQAPEVRRIHER